MSTILSQHSIPVNLIVVNGNSPHEHHKSVPILSFYLINSITRGNKLLPKTCQPLNSKRDRPISFQVQLNI